MKEKLSIFFFDILIELKSFLLEKVTKIAFSFLLWAWMVLRKIYTHFLYGLVTSFDFLTCRILLFRGDLKVDVKAMQLWLFFIQILQTFK